MPFKLMSDMVVLFVISHFKIARLVCGSVASRISLVYRIVFLEVDI